MVLGRGVEQISSGTDRLGVMRAMRAARRFLAAPSLRQASAPVSRAALHARAELVARGCTRSPARALAVPALPFSNSAAPFALVASPAVRAAPAATATWRGASCGATRRARTARRATRGRTARARCPSPRPIACPARTPRRAAEDAGAAAPNKGTTPTRTAARGARDGGGSRSGSGKPATSAHEYDLDTSTT